MSDIITFNTEDALKIEKTPEPIQIETFQLVPENSPILKEVMPEFDFNNPPVNPNNFASSLVETCRLHHGIGLSANQCGFRYRVFVMGSGDNYVAFYNPKITKAEGEQHDIEGCLSFPLLGLRITRPDYIEVEYQDYNGTLRTGQFTGLSSRCFQHELDHMNGIVYTSKVKPLALQMGIKKRNKILKSLRLK
jgi:peptide deformylase